MRFRHLHGPPQGSHPLPLAALHLSSLTNTYCIYVQFCSPDHWRGRTQQTTPLRKNPICIDRCILHVNSNRKATARKRAPIMKRAVDQSSSKRTILPVSPQEPFRSRHEFPAWWASPDQQRSSGQAVKRSSGQPGYRRCYVKALVTH
jgi:hypothetical protein